MNTALDARKGIVKGSLTDIAASNGHSLAQTFVNAEVVVIVDTSGSINTHDSRGGRQRYDVACEELAALQNGLPGKIAVLSFSDNTLFCPDGKPFKQGGSTDLAAALKFAHVADVPDMRFIVISDGEPNDAKAALKEAAQYRNRIDVIYVGPEMMPAGRDFLAKLAAASGGQVVTADRAQNLLEATQKLLEAA
jgi:hypothetical protein